MVLSVPSGTHTHTCTHRYTAHTSQAQRAAFSIKINSINIEIHSNVMDW